MAMTHDMARLKDHAEIFKALAHPARLRIIEALAKGKRCVKELIEMVGSDMSTVSRHLAQLRTVGLVRDDKLGLQVFYELRCPCVLRFLDCVRSVAAERRETAGTLLAVCSCTILPLFAGIYAMAAGLGPAPTFLYSGPAISVLSIVLTANVLGAEIGVARAACAIIFGIAVGLCMQFIFHGEERAKIVAAGPPPETAPPARPLWRTALFFAGMVGILVFANWGRPEGASGVQYAVWMNKWRVVAAFAVLFGLAFCPWFGGAWWRVGVAAAIVAVLARIAGVMPAFVVGPLGTAWVAAYGKGELGDWFEQTWGFAKQIAPLLLIGVLLSVFLLGRVGNEGLVPSEWIAGLVGGNTLAANAFASVAGALMYFATLTEVPVIQGLMGAGMGKGPALTLLLAGPALSLPSILVIGRVLGIKKTAVFVFLKRFNQLYGNLIFER